MALQRVNEVMKLTKTRLKQIIIEEYHKHLNEDHHGPFSPHELPPGEGREQYKKSLDIKLEGAVKDTVKFAISNFENWDRTEVEQEMAKHFEENHLDQVDFEDAWMVLDDDQFKSAFLEFYKEDAEQDPLNTDQFYEWLTEFMDEADYRAMKNKY